MDDVRKTEIENLYEEPVFSDEELSEITALLDEVELHARQADDIDLLRGDIADLVATARVLLAFVDSTTQMLSVVMTESDVYRESFWQAVSGEDVDLDELRSVCRKTDMESSAKVDVICKEVELLLSGLDEQQVVDGNDCGGVGDVE